MLIQSGDGEISTEQVMSNGSAARLELSFEYLIAKDTLKWITITSDQVPILILYFLSQLHYASILKCSIQNWYYVVIVNGIYRDYLVGIRYGIMII